MNLFGGEKLGRKYIGMFTLYVFLFAAWMIFNLVEGFEEFATIAKYLFLGYSVFCGVNGAITIPGIIKNIKNKRFQNGSQKSVQVDQAGTPDRRRDSSCGSDGEGDDDYPEGGPGEGEP